jgi:2-iminoacetate synthase ThiH
VVKATGITTKGGMEDFVELIRNAGFSPVLRDSDYRLLKTL